MVDLLNERLADALDLAETACVKLFLTACSEVRDQITAMQVGGSDHLPKPFRLADLRDKVRSLTRGPKLEGGS